MHTVGQLELALELAGKLGYHIRWEVLDGQGGGACCVRGRRQLFLDLAQRQAEQLETVIAAIASDPAVLAESVEIPAELAPLLKRRPAA